MEGFQNRVMKKVASWKDDPSVQIIWDLALEKLTMLLHLLAIIGGFLLDKSKQLYHLLAEMDIEGFLKKVASWKDDPSVQIIWDLASEKLTMLLHLLAIIGGFLLDKSKQLYHLLVEMDIEGFLKKVASWKEDPRVQIIWDLALEKLTMLLHLLASVGGFLLDKSKQLYHLIVEMDIEGFLKQTMKKVESWKDDPSAQRIWDMALERLTMLLRFLWSVGSFLLDISKQLYHLIGETRGDTLRLWGLPLALALSLLCFFYWSRSGRRTMKAPGRGGVRMRAMKAPGRGGVRMLRSEFEKSPKNYFRGLHAK